MITKLLYLPLFSIIGIFDASYLVYEHYSDRIPPCTTNLIFADCGKVLTSSYSNINGIPVAFFGVFFYLLIFFISLLLIYQQKNKNLIKLLKVISILGVAASLYFIYLQIFVIKAICFYCFISAINTFIIFFVAKKINVQKQHQ